MAPPAKSSTSNQSGGADIRSFFAGPSTKLKVSQQSRPGSSGEKKTVAIEVISSDEETVPKPSLLKKMPSKPHATFPKSATSNLNATDDNTGPAPHAPIRLKRKKSNVLISSDEEDDGPPKKKVGIIVATSVIPQPAKPSPTPKRSKSPNMSPPSMRQKTVVAPSKPKVSPRASSGSKGTKSEQYKFEPLSDSPAEGGLKTKEGTSKAPPNASAKDRENKKSSKVEGKAKSSNFASFLASKAAGPRAPGSKEIPMGQPNCLAGLTFVFTGELVSLSRDEATDLAKRYGGRVTGQPSSRTSFVVLGDNAGPSKVAAIKKHGLTSISEDEFLNLIATKDGVMDGKTLAKMEKEEKKIKDAAKELEKRERQAEKVAAASGSSVSASTHLWTTKYAPQTLKEICGNKTQIERLGEWLQDWSKSLACGFKKPGKNGMNVYRAVLISGPPGIGKTTSAHLVAKLHGFTPIEVNASDARSKKLIENGVNIDNTSLDGWRTGGKMVNAAGVEITNKTVLIMDEVDGMSAGDRGGVVALNALIKKTRIPIICIANDGGAQKLKPLMNSTFKLTFRKPEAASIRSRIMTIAFKEKMKIPAPVVDQLVNGVQSDIRLVLNMLSTWKRSSDSMDFDEGKDLAKMNEKYQVMTPFNAISKLLGPYLFSSTSRETLNDKMELYFHDHSFMPLFVQENYLKTTPSRIKNLDGPDAVMKQLELMDKAASSISDGDLVDRMLHGGEQHWSLMPLHAITSSVRPASYIYGMGGHFGGQNPVSFPSWLGQNSKQNKLQRQLGEVQIRMRLKVSGDKSEIRQFYIPALFPKLVKPLIDLGSEAVTDVIEVMDGYFLSKEDWDTVIELGVDHNQDTVVLKKIPPATKTALTRKYNSSDHPIPFHKQELGKIPRKLMPRDVPDQEDILEAVDAADDIAEDDEKEDEDSMDVGKDKLIKESTKGKARENGATKKATKTKK